ncbi:MAG TPA: ester cyclase [Gemmatimonadaceae bacterium]
MAADKSKRGSSEGNRERETRRQSAAAGGTPQETTRAGGGARTREREREVGLTRESESTREAGAMRGRSAAQDNARIAASLLDLWNDRDFDQLARVATADVECVNVPFDNTTYRGPNGYREFVQGWATAFPDGRAEIRRIVADESGAVVEYTGRGTNTGPLVTPNGTIQPTGRAGELDLCDVVEIENGKVRRIRSYYDSATLMRQLGVLETGTGRSTTSRSRTEAG